MMNNLFGAWMRGRGAGAVLAGLFLLASPVAVRAQLIFTTNNGAITITGCTFSNDVIVIPDSINGYPVTDIGPSAFAGSTVTNFTLPASLTNIEDYAFSFCSGLTGITIPSGVTTIGTGVFAGCSRLPAIKVDVANPHFSGVGGVLFDKNVTTLIACPGAVAGTYLVPNTVTNIGEFAFDLCSKLTGITLSTNLAGIGSYAFEGCTRLTSVIIPNRVTEIDSYAFGGTGITSITIPTDVATIGEGAFGNCTNLATITVSTGSAFFSSANGVLFDRNETALIQFPAGKTGSYTVPGTVGRIGDNAFGGCPRLTGISLPNSVTNIGINAFGSCIKLTTIPIPASVSEIQAGAFDDCTSLTNVLLPAGLKYIGDYLFAGCYKLAEMNIPNGVTNIESGAFEYCTGMKKASLPESLVTIGNLAFEGCSGLKNLVIPQGVATVGGWAFEQCGALTNVTVLGNVTSIGTFAFEGCTNLVAITLPASLTDIEDLAFVNCDSLQAVYFSGDAPSEIGSYIFGDPPNLALIVYYVEGATGWGPTFAGVPTAEWTPPPPLPFTYTNINGEITITSYTGSNGVVVIPDTIDGYPVKRIGANALMSAAFGYGNTGYVVNVTQVMFGTNVNDIESGAFEFGQQMGSLFIPNTVTNIGPSAFQYCGGLTNVVIGTNVVSIGNNAFDYCQGLTNVLIPKNATNLGTEVFLQCAKLAGIGVDAKNPVYSETNGILYDHVRHTLVEAPEMTGGGFSIPHGITNIARGAFMGCTGLTGITISNQVQTVGTNAFSGCTGLTNLLIGTNVMSIATEAFEGCSGLTDVAVPRSVTRLGAAVFSDCTGLTNILIHSGVTNIESGLTGIQTVELRSIPLNIVQVAGNCPHLLAITVVAGDPYYSSTNGILFNQPQTALVEAPGGFTGGYVIPNTVTNVADGAFSACANLTSLIMPDKVVSIGAATFQGCTGLTNLVIGTNVMNLGVLAFANCSALTAVTIPAGVTNIGDGVLIGCWNLTNIVVAPENLYYSSSNGFLFDKHFTKLVQAPAGYAGNYTVPDSVTNIGNDAFDGCRLLAHVTLGSEVAKVGNEAFFGCNSLLSLFFKGNAPSVGSAIFEVFAPPQRMTLPGEPQPLIPPVIYYLPGAQGWSATTFGTRPSVPWNLQVQTNDGGLGVRTNRFGFNVTGSSNVVIVVEACTNLYNPEWRPVQTNVLTDGTTYFGDAQWTNYPGRFYRFRSE